MNINGKHSTDCIGHFFDVLFWYIIYSLPLILMLISWCRGSSVSLSQIFIDSGLSLLATNDLVTSFIGVFGVGGIFPIFVNNDLIVFACYFILTFLIHLMVDCLLFLFRCAHRIVNHGFGGASHE